MMLGLVKVATGLGPRAASASAARWATGARFSPSVPTRECAIEGQTIDYKNTQLLSSFVSDQTGQINRSDVTGLCAKCQRKVARAIKRARNFGLMPYTYKMEIYSKDA